MQENDDTDRLREELDWYRRQVRRLRDEVAARDQQISHLGQKIEDALTDVHRLKSRKVIRASDAAGRVLRRMKGERPAPRPAPAPPAPPAPEPEPPLPNFLVIGAQRAGTTWLYRALADHEDVFLPEKKELEYFSYRSGPVAADEATYRQHFRGAHGIARIGEVTPSYLWAAQAPDHWDHKPDGFEDRIPERVRDTLGPDVKLIVSLRDPVDRAVSAFLLHVRADRVDVDDSILEVGDQGGIVAMGFYHRHLSRWLEVFDPSQILILDFEQLQTWPGRTYRQVCAFLGIADDLPPEHLASPANRSPASGEDDSGDIVLGNGATTSSGRPIGGHVLATVDELATLRELYADDVRELAELVPFDVSGWLPGSQESG